MTVKLCDLKLYIIYVCLIYVYVCVCMFMSKSITRKRDLVSVYIKIYFDVFFKYVRKKIPSFPLPFPSFLNFKRNCW